MEQIFVDLDHSVILLNIVGEDAGAGQQRGVELIHQPLPDQGPHQHAADRKQGRHGKREDEDKMAADRFHPGSRV